jgi:hypothetical protein
MPKTRNLLTRTAEDDGEIISELSLIVKAGNVHDLIGISLEESVD